MEESSMLTSLPDHLDRQILSGHARWLDFVERVSEHHALSPIAAGRPSLLFLLRHLLEDMSQVLAAAGIQDLPERPGGKAGWAEMLQAFRRTSDFWCERMSPLQAKVLLQNSAVDVHPAFRETHNKVLTFVTGHLYHLQYHQGQIAMICAHHGYGWPRPDRNQK